MTFLSSTVACWRSALLALLPPSQWAAGFEASGNKKEVELAALWCSHHFFPEPLEAVLRAVCSVITHVLEGWGILS